MWVHLNAIIKQDIIQSPRSLVFNPSDFFIGVHEGENLLSKITSKKQLNEQLTNASKKK